VHLWISPSVVAAQRLTGVSHSPDHYGVRYGASSWDLHPGEVPEQENGKGELEAKSSVCTE
jgi:hypothetical protein